MAVSGEGNEAPPKAPSWLQVAVANAGMVRAATAISWAWCWGITRADIGHDPTVEEVAEWWGASVRTAYRDHANFKKSFPFLDDPTLYVEQAEVKPLVEGAAKKMSAFAERVQARRREKRERRPVDLAAISIGFLPCRVSPT